MRYSFYDVSHLVRWDRVQGMVERSQKGDEIRIKVVESRRGAHFAGYAIKSR